MEMGAEMRMEMPLDPLALGSQTKHESALGGDAERNQEEARSPLLWDAMGI